MKQLLATLPTLIAPVDGEILYLYIAIANEAFGSVLIVERNKDQKPVYFVSKALAGSEINYAPIKKFIYALVLTSRRLCRYFQGHPIHVLTDLSVKQVLSTLAVSGRLAKCAIELGAFEIAYLPRTSVKGQVLADYLAEMTGAGAGLVLTSPSGEDHTYALCFNFDVTNNEAEYEALLARLNMLVANQFNGSFKAHELSMQKYLKLLQEVAEKFEFFELTQVSRSQNKKADALSKLAVLTFLHFQKQVWVEELPNKSIDGSLIVVAIEEVHPNWMDPIMHYLRNNTLPEDKKEARIMRERSPMYVIENDMLYCMSYLGPLMQCVGPAEAATIIEEVYSGSCALHSGYKTIAAKLMRMGYFWPTLYRDVAQIFKRCKSCQRFGIPRELVSDNGAQIAKDPFLSWCAELNIIQKFTSVAHPQANRLCEVTNRDIVSGIRKRLNEKRNGWVDELSNVLWAHRTTFKKSTSETPFSLVYGSEAMIPAEGFVQTHRVTNFYESVNADNICENLNFIEERRHMDAIRETNNKQQIASITTTRCAR
ncbi:uncharacterized protein [Rutidosis leptorrhynchoides]|uniref:uncharacterized protein n=1 Tax=Rutidosis leptorrhynchoides TaxID=125765 RepID=UPI003A996C97